MTYRSIVNIIYNELVDLIFMKNNIKSFDAISKTKNTNGKPE